MSKTLNYEQITEKLNSVKAEKKEVNNAIGAIRLKHKIQKGEKPKDKKLLAEWNRLHEQKEVLNKEVEKLEASALELKPKKERETKYNYPEDCVTSEQKKAYRTKMRAQANAAEKAEKPAKKEKKAAAPEVEAKPSKKDKKAKTKEVEVEVPKKKKESKKGQD